MNIAHFAELAYERHAIYLRRSAGLVAPWTDDPVFQVERFCNVFRRIDKTTAWIMDNVATPLMNDPYLWAALVQARYVSRIETLEDMKANGAFEPSMDWHDRRKAGEDALLRRFYGGAPVYTCAFMLSSCLGDWGPTKAHYLSNLLIAMDEGDFTEKLEDDNATMRSVWAEIAKYRAIGSFMAYQYACDFSYIPQYLMGAEDAFSWSASGPGSRRGMSRLVYGNDHTRMNPVEWLGCAKVLFDEWLSYIEKTLPAYTKKMVNEISPSNVSEDMEQTIDNWVKDECGRFLDIRMQDAQHWMCEYDKYEKGGRSKRRFEGGLA